MQSTSARTSKWPAVTTTYDDSSQAAIASATGPGGPAVRIPTIACESNPRPSGLVTPVTWRMFSSQSRP